MELLLANAGKVRRTNLNGREYLVAPMTLIVHGVLNGSKGSLYYPLQEISREPGIWNHIPIVVYHPIVNGENVSAKDPGVLDRSGIGILRNSKIDGDRLRAEGWFDVERTRRIDPRVLNALENNRSIELSTGLYTENEPAPMGANYKGVGYEFIARNYKPDHLAILPDQIGACGIRDGCGVLVNTHNTLESTRVYRTASGKILFIDNCGGKGGKPGPCKGWKGTSAVSAIKATQTVETPVTPPGPISTKGKEPKTKAVEVAKTPTKATQKPRASKVIEQHSIPQGTFGPSKAEIEFEGATHKKQMESLAKKFLGTKATTKDLASIAGAPDGATVRLEQGTRISDSVTVRFAGTHDGHEYNASRTIYKKDGELVVKNNVFYGKGVGIEVFGRQVENATRLGAKHIEMTAAGSFIPGPDPKKSYSDYNGYYTWPRMGVDAKVPSKSYSKLPPGLKKDVDKADGNVRGLMGTEKGRDWWLRNGTSLDHAKFDLKPGSYSQKTLASYLASRKGKGESTTSNVSKPEDDKQSNEIHQDDIDWDTLDAVNDHIGIKESKSNNSVTVGNTRVYRTASGKVLLIDNANPEGCNQYQGCDEGGDSGKKPAPGGGKGTSGKKLFKAYLTTMDDVVSGKLPTEEFRKHLDRLSDKEATAFAKELKARVGKDQDPRDAIVDHLRPFDDVEPKTTTGRSSTQSTSTPTSTPSESISLHDHKELGKAVSEVGKGLKDFFDNDWHPPEGKWDSHRVPISDVYKSLEHRLPKGTSIETFKKSLLEAHLKGDVLLSRNDLPMFRPDASDESEISHLNATFHAVEVNHRPTSNSNPEGCNQYKDCGEGETASDRKARASAKREEYKAKVEKIKETISPEHAQAVHDTIRELGGHVRSKLSGITKGVDENDLLDGIRKKGVDIGPTGLKGYKLLDKMQFVGWLGKGETGGDSLSPKVVRYHLPISDEGLALNSPTPLGNSNPEGCNQYKGCDGGETIHPLVKEHISTLLPLEHGAKTVDKIHREKSNSYTSTYHSTVVPLQQLETAGIVEKVGSREGHIEGIGAGYAGPGSTSHSKVEKDDPARDIYQLTEKGAEHLSKHLGREIKVQKPVKADKDNSVPTTSDEVRQDYESRKSYHQAMLKSANSELAKAKGKPKLTKTAQDKIKTHEKGLKDLEKHPGKSTSNQSYVDTDTVSNSTHTISSPVVVPPTFSRGDRVGNGVSPVELSSNSTRLERFIHWLIGNVSVENCGGKGGKPGPCPSGRKAYVPHPRQPAAPKPEIVKPPRAKGVKPPTAPTPKPPTPTAKTPSKATPVPKTPKPPVSLPTPAPAPKPTPTPSVKPPIPTKGKGKEPKGTEPKPVSPTSKLLKSTVDDVHGHITDLLKNPDKITAKHVEDTAKKLMDLTSKDMKSLAEKLGVTGLKGGDLKAKLAEKISKGALEGKSGSKDTGKGADKSTGGDRGKGEDKPVKGVEKTKESEQVKPQPAPEEKKPETSGIKPLSSGSDFVSSAPKNSEPPPKLWMHVGGNAYSYPPKSPEEAKESGDNYDKLNKEGRERLLGHFKLDPSLKDKSGKDFTKAIEDKMDAWKNTLPVHEIIAHDKEMHDFVKAIAGLNPDHEKLTNDIEKSKKDTESLLATAKNSQPGQKGDIRRQLNDLEDQRADLEARTEANRKSAHEQLHKALKTGEATSIKFDMDANIDSYTADGVHRAKAFLTGIVAKGTGNNADMPEMPISKDTDRAHFTRGTGIHISNGNAGIIVHEMAHGMEEFMPGIHEACKEFLKHRVGDEPQRHMKDLFPDHGYDDTETGRKDQFDKVFEGASAYYVGKHYDGASEVLSMGLEKLHNNPIDFAKKDPEYCAFVVGMLNGRYRKRNAY